nr:immunoglobulin heavy chain junction region [Macaca mulatta]MOW49131.1 immunoglobulin heavy chain junction region [Macaca mulatta]MOW50412.1 immunoglobulin heavy chain junction region [Macaca mulatta]
CTTNSWNTDSW